MALYDGPIIDAHHHLWTYAPAHFPWLAGDGNQFLQRHFTTGDYRAAAEDLDIVGTVWIEALAVDPHAEVMAAVAAQHDDPAIACAIVAHADLDAADIEDQLDRLISDVPGLRGIRDIVALRPGHAPLARRPDLLRRPAFEAGLRALAERGLSVDLMLEPGQMGDALGLARRLPRLTVLIEHAGSPDFSTAAGTALWREAMRAASEQPNIAVKISALHCRMPDWTDERLAGPILDLRDWFGAARLAFGSDFPVHDRHCPFKRAFETIARAVAAWPLAEQRALFHDNARRLYRF